MCGSNVRAPDVLLALRRHDDVITLSVDLGGQALHQRGYRDGGGGVAPLRENLAAVLVMLARFDARREILLDPMAGSGTIAIEAALMGRGEPLWPAAPEPPGPGQPSGPRSVRRPAALRLPAFAGRAPLTRPLFGDTRPRVVASDIDTRQVALARRNVAAAGVEEAVRVLHGDVRQLTLERVMRAVAVDAGARGDAGAGAGGAEAGAEPPTTGVILANPPYGARLSHIDPVALYRDLGAWCRQFAGWRAAFLVANREFEGAFGGRPRVVKPLRNGNQPAAFYLYDL